MTLLPALAAAALTVTVHPDPPPTPRERREDVPFEVPVVFGAPVNIDGRHTDPVWAQAPAVPLRALDTGGPASASTARVALDPSALFLAMEVADGAVHDVVIDPTGARQTWDHLTVRRGVATRRRCSVAAADPGSDGVLLSAAVCEPDAPVEIAARGARLELAVPWSTPPTAQLRIGWSERGPAAWQGGTWSPSGDPVSTPDHARRIEGAPAGRFVLTPSADRAWLDATLRTPESAVWQVTAWRLGAALWRGEVRAGDSVRIPLEGRSQWSNVVLEARQGEGFLVPAIVTPVPRPELSIWLGTPVVIDRVWVAWETDTGWEDLPVRVGAAAATVDLPRGTGTLEIPWDPAWGDAVEVQVGPRAWTVRR